MDDQLDSDENTAAENALYAVGAAVAGFFGLIQLMLGYPVTGAVGVLAAIALVTSIR